MPNLLDKMPDLNKVPNATLDMLWLAGFYLIGYFIHRIGSLFLEPTLKFIGMPWREYKYFNKFSKTNPKLKTLSREYGVSRTLSSLFVIISIVLLFNSSYNLFLLALGLTILFILSMIKYAKKIVEIIDHNKKGEK